MHRCNRIEIISGIFVICLIVLLPQYLFAQPLDTEETAVIDTVNGEKKVHIVNGVPLSKSPTGAFLRSMIIPGWGQAYTHNWFKSIAFFGTDVGMIYGIYVQDKNALDYKAKARNAKDEEEALMYEGLADFYRDDRNRLIWWTAGIVLLSAFDAYVEAHLYDFEIDPTLGASPTGDGASIGIQITF